MEPSPVTSNPAPTGTLQIDLTALATCLVITAIGYFAVVNPVLEAQSARHLERIELATRQERLTKQTATVSSLTHDLANMRRIAAGMPTFQTLPAQQSNQRLADLMQLAAESKLNVDEMRTAALVSTDRFQVVPIHFAGSGAFQQCTSFLHRLRSAFPDTAVSSLRISKMPNMPAEYATFRFELSWYASPANHASVAAVRP